MPIVSIIIVLAVVGLLLWAVGQIPMDPTIARLLRVVAIVLVCLWLISVFFGGYGHIGGSWPCTTR